MDEPPEKNTLYILAAIGLIVGAIFAKLPKIPVWLVIVGAVAGGVAGFYALGYTVSDFVLGAGAGAFGPYVFAALVDAVKKWLDRKAGSKDNTDG